MLTSKDKQTLERLMDAYEVQNVLSAMVEISHEKAEHVRSNWQDQALSRAWIRTARVLDKAAQAFREFAR